MKERLTIPTIFGYLFGQRAAIQTVASSSAAIWTGIALTLLTAFARNYDQTYVVEKPFLWFFGPLLFSLVSGSWIYLVCYALCARLQMPENDRSMKGSWRGFMGAFWMTAPIAWLYAIPVERFMDSVTAAKANLALLAVVSLWRVLLMARVLQVVTRAPYLRALLWVILAASVEVVVLVFTSGSLTKRVMAAMGGLRNSPEEEVLITAMNNAFGMALWGFGIAFVGLLIWRREFNAERWPRIVRKRTPWTALVVALAGWTIIAVPAQRQLLLNHQLEQHIARKEWRAALDLMTSRQPVDFAPARPLPPKLYENTVFREALGLAGALEPSDERWVIEHVERALNKVSSHWKEIWQPGGDGEVSVEKLENLVVGFDIQPADVLPLLRSTNAVPEIEGWLERNPAFLLALHNRVADWHQSNSDSVETLKRTLEERGLPALPEHSKSSP
ncbi:MAG TPA: hypothetical protein DCY13_02545 [Verrucomicrobiales bacterium]|nr:hypothetical protein [Verrucomicrobiales bacterium]